MKIITYKYPAQPELITTDSFVQSTADEIENCESPAEAIGRLLETLYTKGLLTQEEVGKILDIEIISIS